MTDGGVIEEKQKDSDRKKSKLVNLENYRNIGSHWHYE